MLRVKINNPRDSVRLNMARGQPPSKHKNVRVKVRNYIRTSTHKKYPQFSIVFSISLASFANIIYFFSVKTFQQELNFKTHQDQTLLYYYGKKIVYL